MGFFNIKVVSNYILKAFYFIDRMYFPLNMFFYYSLKEIKIKKRKKVYSFHNGYVNMRFPVINDSH